MAKVRMLDIANQVGVSAVTVHNALTGQKGVSDVMRERIIAVAKEMGYFQDQRKSGSLKSIGVLVSEKYLAEYTTFYWKMYQEIALAAPDKGCIVTVDILKHETITEMRLPRSVEENALEGLILMGEIDRDYISLLQSRIKIPLIFLDFHYKEVSDDAVVTDGFYGMYQMTEYLYEKGFRNMAYVGSVHATSSIMDRYCGFYRAVVEHGLPAPAQWRMEDRDETGEIILKLPDPMPEAFVCNCDLVASKLVDVLRENGYRVPQDISVVGFDNYLYPGLPNREITTYEVNMKGMAEMALRKVLKRIEDPAAMKRIDIIAGRLVEKGSVRTAEARRDKAVQG